MTERDDEQQKKDDGRRKVAARIWRSALAADKQGDHRRVRAYLAERGIDLERLPGGVVPPSLRFDPNCLDVYTSGGWETAPAMVARCVTPNDPAHIVSLVHRTFLDPGGEPKKREELDDTGEGVARAARMHKGVPDGHSINLYDHTVAPELAAAGPFPGGVLILGEGLETTMACMTATGHAARSTLDIGGMKRVVLEPDIFEPFTADGAQKPDGWWVHTIILAADLDRSATGQRQTPEARDRLAIRHPRATVLVRFPTPRVAPTLVEAAGSGERSECPRCHGKCRLRPSDPTSICPKCGGDGEVGFWPGQHRPARDASGRVSKGADWLDVAVVAGLDAVKTGLLDGVDLEGNRGRALAWRAESPTASTPAGAPAHASAPDLTRGPLRDTRGKGWTFGAGGEAPKHLEGLVQYIDGFQEPVLSQSPLHRAWAYLLMECAPPAGSRRFTLAYWGGAFYHFDGSGGAWIKLPDKAMEGIVQRWLQKFRHVKADGDVVLINPTQRAVTEVLSALAAEVLVDVSKVPTWLPDSLDAAGVPSWGAACRVWEARKRREELERRFGNAEEWIVFPNGRLSLRALLERRVVLEPNTPTLFTPAARPYELPRGELQQAIVSGFTDDLFTRLCPWWRKALHDWCSGDPDGGVQRVRQLQLMFGDSISPNRTLEKIFLVSGPKRSGKGCVQEALKAACGEEAVATPSFFDLGDRFGLVPFLGKSLVIFSDAHMGHATDSSRVTEVLKVVSGNDAVTVRDLHQAPMTNVKLGCRIWAFVNDMVRLSDSSGALAGRLVIWPMLKSFYDGEEAEVKQGIMREGAGIAVWALCGYVELFSMKRPAIEMGQRARSIAEEFADSSSVILSFLRQCCVCREVAPGRFEVDYNPDHAEPFGEVYGVYLKFCESQRNQPVANNRFVAQLRPHVPLIDIEQLGSGTRLRQLIGIKLRADLDPKLRGGEGERLVSYDRVEDRRDAQMTLEQRFPT